MHLQSWEQEDISFFWTETVTKSSPVDSPASTRLTPSQAVLLSFLLTGHKPSVWFLLLLYFLFWFLFCLFLSGTSSHPHQPSLLFPWEPLVYLMKAWFTQATQSNLIHLLFSISVGFQRCVQNSRRKNTFVHLCWGWGGDGEQSKGKDRKG